MTSAKKKKEKASLLFLKFGRGWRGNYFSSAFFFVVVLEKKILASPKQFCSVEFKIEEMIFFFPLYLVLREDCKWFGGLASTLAFFSSHI